MEKVKAFWTWFDETNLDLQLISCWILWCGWQTVRWSMDFATGAYSATDEMSSVGMAAIIAAVNAPWATVLGFALKFLFKVRE
jgi:hypothetical protein